MPAITRPKTANPCPSAFRAPPKSNDGWSPIMIENEACAESGPPRAIESAPSTCLSPVTLVRSSGIGENISRRRRGLGLKKGQDEQKEPVHGAMITSSVGRQRGQGLEGSAGIQRLLCSASINIPAPFTDRGTGLGRL